MTLAETYVPPAPVDQAELERALRPFGDARMLLRSAYADPAVLAWERAHLFGGWVCVARAEDVPVGGLAAQSLGDYGVLLKEWRLLQRAVFVIGRDGRIVHAEYVPDQMAEPDYAAAVAAGQRAAG